MQDNKHFEHVHFIHEIIKAPNAHMYRVLQKKKKEL